MSQSKPHYLLFTETGVASNPFGWKFTLREAGTLDEFEVSDEEPDVEGERLELLTVIRALESLDRPSRITLMGAHGYLRNGIRCGMPEWRRSDWLWERFGEMVPVKHADLWQRLDHAMLYHSVDFCKWRIDRAHAGPRPAETTLPVGPTTLVNEHLQQRPWWMPLRKALDRLTALGRSRPAELSSADATTRAA